MALQADLERMGFRTTSDYRSRRGVSRGDSEGAFGWHTHCALYAFQAHFHAEAREQLETGQISRQIRGVLDLNTARLVRGVAQGVPPA